MNPLVLKNLTKTFRHFKRQTPAVKSVSFEVEKSGIFGLIGPDGAGKTTLIRMIVSLLIPDQGEIFFQGKSVYKNISYVRSVVGYMPQRFSLYPDLTVEQNLQFYANLFGLSKKEQGQYTSKLFDFSGLGQFKKRKAGALSGGMKQKLALICVLIHQPEVLILDEPTVGVDPLSRQEFWEILHNLSAQGKTILTSTSYLDEAAQCHKVGLMDQGKLLTAAEPDILCAQYNAKDLAEVFTYLQRKQND